MEITQEKMKECLKSHKCTVYGSKQALSIKILENGIDWESYFGIKAVVEKINDDQEKETIDNQENEEDESTERVYIIEVYFFI